MAQLTINIPDAQLVRVLAALSAPIPQVGITPPVLTQAQQLVIARKQIIEFIKATVIRYERAVQVKDLAPPADTGIS